MPSLMMTRPSDLGRRGRPNHPIGICALSGVRVA